MPILKTSQVVQYGHDPASCFSTVCLATQTTPHHLHVADWTEDCTGYENHVDLWRVETGAQNRVIAKNAYFATLESGQEITPCCGWSISADCGRGNTFKIQSSCHFLTMQDGVGKEQYGTFHCFLDTGHKSFVALLAACQPLVNRFRTLDLLK